MNTKTIAIRDSSDDRSSPINFQEYLRTTTVSNSPNGISPSDNKSGTYQHILSLFNQRSYRLLFWTIYRNCFTTKLIICQFISFTIIAMMVAILTVNFTLAKVDQTCHVTIKNVMENSIVNNAQTVSVLLGHFNNDSYLDIVVANSGANTIGIFMAYDNGSFAEQTTYSTGTISRPVSIARGDFNQDHFMDIVVVNYDSHTVGTFLGHGDGTFADQIEFFLGPSRPLSIAVGNFNNDLWLDIVVTNNGTNSIDVLFGYNNGSFGRRRTYSTGYDSFPYSVAVGDFNNDKQLDIAVANYGTNNIGIFLGRNYGIFENQLTFSTNPGSGPFSITLGDFNNDQHLDIIVANYRANNVGIHLGYGNGTFATQRTYFLGARSNPCNVAAGLINKDNLLDIVVSLNGTDSISMLVGYGNGTFATPQTHSLSIDSSPIGLAIGDIDNDKQSDVVVSNFGTNDILTLMRYTIISSTNQLAYPLNTGAIPWQLVLSDFNNDNYLDIAANNYGSDSIEILRGYGDGTFGESTRYDTGKSSRPMGVVAADVNNDNYSDLVIINCNVGYANVLLGYGNGSFNVIKSFFYEASSSPFGAAVGDFNNDNRLDIVLPSFGYNTITIYLGYGNGSFDYLETYPTGDGSRPLFAAVGDFNNDKCLDIVVTNTYLDNIGIFLGYGNGTFSAQTTYSTDIASLPLAIALADFNNDSCLDIVVANSGTNNVGIFLGYCNGTFAAQRIYSTGLGSTPTWVTSSDINNDQWPDLVVANMDVNTIGVLLGYGNGTFASQLTFSSGSDSVPYCVSVGDVNNDNRMDVVVANHATSDVAVLLGHTNSKETFILGHYDFDFEREIFYRTGSSSRPYSIVVDDINNDTYMDIVVANSGNENIGILLGYDNENFASEVTYSIGHGSHPKQIITADFNRDSYLDIAIANPSGGNIDVLFGYNNGSFAISSSISFGIQLNPSSIAVGDINNDQWLDLVIANKEAHTIGIMFGFNYASFQHTIRSSTGDYSNPIAFALADFNNDNQLDIVTSNYYTNNVGVLLSYGNGSFASPLMYGHVVGSHPWAVGIGDFNEDHKLDITIAIWGVNKMGIILGNGDGTFGEPFLYPTGFGSRPLAVAVADFNHDNHLDIATCNYGGSTVSIFLGYGNGTFTNATIFSTGDRSGPSSINVDDLNKDNHLDIFVANEITYSIGVLYGNGDGSFKNVMMYMADPDTSPQYAISGDFNKDTLPDMALAIFGTGDIGIFLGYGNETFSPIKLYTSGFSSGTQYLSLGDLNNDSYVDIAFANINTGDLGILFGNGDGTFKNVALYSTGPRTSVYTIAVADINNDNRLDMVFNAININEVGVRLGNGFKPLGSYTPLSYVNDSSPSSIAIGDFNNDTWLDIGIANTGTDNIGILLGHGNGSFDDIKMYSTGNNSEPLSIALSDFNNDAILDIAIVNSKANNIILFFGSGNGSFENSTVYSTGTNSYPVFLIVGDYNHDSFVDIVVANSGTNAVGIFINYGNGTFANQIFYDVGYNGRPSSVAFGDFNHDNWIDIAVANYNTNDIKILFNCPHV